MASRLVLILIDVRSAHNVGSMLRTADAMAVERVYLVGITPYPSEPDDKRLPHVRAKADWDIHKTALGAERSLKIKHLEKAELRDLLRKLKQDGFVVAALEQTAKAKRLDRFQPPPALALVLGNELKGVDAATLKLADQHLSIPMLGAKESLNVAVASGMALYHVRFSTVDKDKL